MEFLEIEKYTSIEPKYYDYLKKLSEYCKTNIRRPKYHICPPCGLLNDPNGMAYFQGNYHIFYQWFPFEPNHGMKHWAHVVSKDLIHWEWSNEILIPTYEYEKNGCYSGNAVVKDNRQYLFYTANYKQKDGRIPKQGLAWLESDGTIHKYDDNPIIDGVPEGLTGDIRDPFVFEKDGHYYMLLGGAGQDRKGKLLLYYSDDLFQWNYEGMIAIEHVDIDLGYMFECPSYIQIDGKDVLLLSLMGLDKEEGKYQNEFSTLYFTGILDLEQKKFTVEYYDEVDKGFDFYAPQAFYGKENRPLLIGWCGCGVQNLPYEEIDMWKHGLTLPRELYINSGKLIQRLADELESEFEKQVIFKNDKSKVYPLGTTYKVHIDRSEQDISQVQLGDDNDFVSIKIDPAKGILTIDRSHLQKQFSEQYGVIRSCSYNKEKPPVVDIYYDNTFIEIYVNRGEKVLTLRAFPGKNIVTFK